MRFGVWRCVACVKNRIKVRCPMDFSPPDVPEDGIYGLKRVTRHPMFMCVQYINIRLHAVYTHAHLPLSYHLLELREI